MFPSTTRSSLHIRQHLKGAVSDNYKAEQLKKDMSQERHHGCRYCTRENSGDIIECKS